MIKNKTYLAYEKAVECLRECVTRNGFYASAGKKGYNAVWSRDSMTASLGASLVKDESLKRSFLASINTLGKNQSPNGQIPNCVDKWEDRTAHVDFKTVDSSMWFIIGNHVYSRRYNDRGILRKNRKWIDKALKWLACQDTGELGMITQLPTSDWQDAFPHRYGYTINSEALYYRVLTLEGKKKEAEKLKKIVNENKDDGLWNGEYYIAYRWKNHGQYKEEGEWFDSLGNVLAIVFDLADKKRANRILDYIEKNKINKPYALKTIYPPIDRKSKYWQDYYLDCDAGTPNHYSNGGIWGFIGGFYVLALVKMERKNWRNLLKEI